MHLAKIWDIFDTNSDDIDIKEENASENIEDPSKKIHI
jgi:hypothetical protein